MNYSKDFKIIVVLLKIKFLLLLLSIFSLGIIGCELIDDEHCQYETNESRIWYPDQHPSYYFVEYDENLHYDHKILFEFNYSSDAFQSNFNIDNSCPYGALALNIKITEKDLGIDEVHSYYGDIFEVQTVKEKKVYKKIDNFKFNRISEKELISADILNDKNVVIELVGLLDNGPKKFFITCYALVFPLSPYKVEKYENWAKENIKKVEFKVNYIKWD